MKVGIVLLALLLPSFSCFAQTQIFHQCPAPETMPNWEVITANPASPAIRTPSDMGVFQFNLYYNSGYAGLLNALDSAKRQALANMPLSMRLMEVDLDTRNYPTVKVDCIYDDSNNVGGSSRFGLSQETQLSGTSSVAMRNNIPSDFYPSWGVANSWGCNPGIYANAGTTVVVNHICRF